MYESCTCSFHEYTVQCTGAIYTMYGCNIYNVQCTCAICTMYSVRVQYVHCAVYGCNMYDVQCATVLMYKNDVWLLSSERMQLTRRRSPAVDNNLLYSYPNSRKLLPPTPLLDESRAASRVDGRLESRTEVSLSKVSKQLAGGRHLQWCSRWHHRGNGKN